MPQHMKLSSTGPMPTVQAHQQVLAFPQQRGERRRRRKVTTASLTGVAGLAGKCRGGHGARRGPVFDLGFGFGVWGGWVGGWVGGLIDD